MLINIPNILTLTRIALIPIIIIIWYLPYSWANIACMMVFVLASITDWLDGYLARKLNQSSPFGAFLDPVADKLMVASALVLIVEQTASVWITIAAIIIIGREITISALREWMAELGERNLVKVSILGKVKTTMQIIAISMLLFHDDLFSLPIYKIGEYCLYAASALTLWSMMVYLIAAKKHM